MGRGCWRDRVAVLERLVAGVIIIGALLWAASTLATPDAPPDLGDEAAVVPPATKGSSELGPDVPDPEEGGTAPVPEEDDDDDDEERESGSRKGKRRDGDA